MLPKKAPTNHSKSPPMTILEAQKYLSEIILLTDQPFIGLETFQSLQIEMDRYRVELEANRPLYKSEDAWLKVCNVYMLAYYRVMLRVSELLERKSA